MTALAENEKHELIQLIEAGKPIPESWRHRLFPNRGSTAEAGKEYRFVYDGKPCCSWADW